jgi:Na+-driven multidrug efflux pump
MAAAQSIDQRQKMLETPIPPLICRLAVPTIISMLVTAIYNTADTYFVSHLGESATGAVGIVFSVMDHNALVKRLFADVVRFVL